MELTSAGTIQCRRMSRGASSTDSTAKLIALLAKIPHFDKDERYMAVLGKRNVCAAETDEMVFSHLDDSHDLAADIQNELMKDPKIDASLEKRLCVAILDRIEKDTSNDVQAISVKCLSVLVKKAQEAQVVEVTARLWRQILEGSVELR